MNSPPSNLPDIPEPSPISFSPFSKSQHALSHPTDPRATLYLDYDLNTIRIDPSYSGKAANGKQPSTSGPLITPIVFEFKIRQPWGLLRIIV